MPSPSPTVVARARLAQAVKAYGRDSGHPELTEARRAYAGEHVYETASRIMAGAPPLAPEDVDRVVAVLRPAETGHLAAVSA